jgi:hypothetical protein
MVGNRVPEAESGKESGQRHSLKASTAEKPEDEFQRDLGKYLDEMGVSRELLVTMGKVPAGLLQNLRFSDDRCVEINDRTRVRREPCD